MKRCYLLITLVACVSAAVAQQQPRQSTPPKAEPQDEEVVRISTTLVQVDALVTGKGGKPVTDLKAEDFEVFEDGRPQRISNFSYVETRTTGASWASTNRP